MASTTFTNGVTLTDEDWFNDVNRLHYTIFGDPANIAAAQATFFAGANMSASAVGGGVVATQTLMESASSVVTVVTPGRVHFHPGVAKVWVKFDGSATSVTASVAYNVSSITDDGSGNYTVNFASSLSSANYVHFTGTIDSGAATNNNVVNVRNGTTPTASSIALAHETTANGASIDSALVTLGIFGDL
jgi:hypothetical protein